MKLRYLLFALLLPAVTSAQHVILISIDGLKPEMYTDPAWPAPNMHMLVKKGTSALKMLSVFPAYTYPAHTAMLTGALPRRTGIAYNAPLGSKGEWNWFTSAIKTPTLWDAMKAQGMSTAAVEWPVSAGAPITWNVPEIWAKDKPEDRITETRKYASPGLIEEMEAYATGKLDSLNMSEEHFSLDANSAKMAAYLFKTRKPKFLAVHFALVDGCQHDYGTGADSVRLALATADQGIGTILQSIRESKLQDSTTVLIVGDHGFSTMKQALNLNRWLKDGGLLEQAFFQPAGGSAFLYPRNKQSPDMDKIVTRLNALPDSLRKLFRIIEKRELNRMGGDSAALMAVSAKPGTVFGGAPGDDLLFSVHGGHHGYDPAIPEMWTGFIASGKGIRNDHHIEELSVTDISSLIATLLGLNFKAPDGKVPKNVLR